MNILHRFLIGKWYDEINTGTKREEYFDMKWIPRICAYVTSCPQRCRHTGEPCRHGNVPTNYTHICFHRGYTKTTMLWKIENVTIGTGNPEWGAPIMEPVVIVKLNKRET